MSCSFPLNTIDLFASVKPQTVEAIYLLTRERRYKRREILFFPDDLSHGLYLIGQGTVRLYKLSSEGKELTLWVLGPGECFGELTLIGGVPYDCYAEALENVRLGILTKENLQALVNADPSLLWSITKLIASRRRDVEMQLQDFAFKNVPSRLATLLLRLAQKHGNRYPKGIFNQIKLTQKEIATLIGAARSTTTKNLNRFKRLGALDFNRERLFIRERSTLERIAMGETEYALREAFGLEFDKTQGYGPNQ